MQNAPTTSGAGAENAGAQDAAQTGATDSIGSITEIVNDFPGFIEQNTPLIIDYSTRIAGVVVLVIIGLILAGWAGRITSRSLERAKMELTLSKFFGRLVRWAVLVLVALAILGVFGIPTASFAVVIGAAGLAIGLALQGTLSNFAAGIMLLIFRPFKVGDVVNIAGVLGKVDEVQVFTTTVDTFDNRRFIIPNSNIFGQTIENITYHPKRRVDVNVGTEYSADLRQTREVLETAARNVEGRLQDMDIFVWLDSMGDSSINWQVRVWCATPDWAAVRQALTRDVKNALDEAGIGIPFPQRDVHLFQESKD